MHQDYDKQLQRALNYDNFEAATELRRRREQLTEAIDGFQVQLPLCLLPCFRACISVYHALIYSDLQEPFTSTGRAHSPCFALYTSHPPV